MNYNQKVSRLSKAGANTIQYQSIQLGRGNPVPNFQDDIQTLQMLQMLGGQRKTGLERAESMLMSYMPYQQPFQQPPIFQPMTMSYVQPQIPSQQAQSSSIYKPQKSENKYGDRVLQFVERQNQILQQLGSALAQQRQPPQPQYQPYELPTVQLPQLHPSAPPPIYLPPHLQKYANSDEKQVEVAEKIRILMMLKKVRDENLLLKSKLRQKAQKKIEKVQESYQDDLSVRAPSKVPSQNGRNVFDLENEKQTLDDMKRNRGRLNLHKIKIYYIQVGFIYRTRKLVQEKISNLIESFLDDYAEALNSINSWVKPFIETVNAKMKSVKNFSCCITQIDDVKVSESTAKKNLPSLQQFVKAFIDQIVDNADTFPEEAKELLAKLTGKLIVAPKNYFFKFELNRLNFNELGGIINPTLFKGQMIILTMVVVRAYLNEISKLYEEPPKGSNKDQITAAKKVKSNILHIISCIYEVLMEYLKSIVPFQQDNQAFIAVEHKVKPRQALVLAGNLGEVKQIFNDDIILQPTIESSKLQLFFSDRKFVQNMQALLENLGTQIYEASQKLSEYDRRTAIERYKESQLPSLQRIIEQTKAEVENILVDRDFLLADCNNKIEAQIELIKQIS